LVWPRNDLRWKIRGVIGWGIIPMRMTAPMAKMPPS
jgi:hypothetical protein